VVERAGIGYHQPAWLADPPTFTTDKQLIENRYAALRAAIVDDEVAERLVGLPTYL
jgi:hypothetical protein